MAGREEQPDWSSLPSDLLELIGQRSRDAVTGLTTFRSVCRTWRAAVGPAPRLLLPRAGSASEPTLVFPLSCGWSIVVDARYASCHLSHLATGATAPLPKLNAVHHGNRIAHLRYEHRPDDAMAAALRICRSYYITYLSFTDWLRFAVHLPPDSASAVAGMTIMMYHFMQGGTGMLFCRPGDATWTMVKRPNPIGSFGFFDFVYHDGRMFGMESNSEMVVYDAATLDVLHLVQPPRDRPNLVSKMYYGGTPSRYYVDGNLEELNYINLVSLPSKLILVRASFKSSLPVAFSIFELRSTLDGLAWHKVTNAGNYELFLDRYHTSFRENGSNSGTRIYYVHDNKTSLVPSITSVYYYSMQDSKLECVYTLPDDAEVYSTKASWFVP